MSLIADYHGKQTRSRAMGLHQSSVYAGTVLGGVVAGFCGERFGWQSGFYIFGTLGIVLAIVLVFFLREPVRETAQAPDARPSWDVFAGVGEVVRIPMALVLAAVFVGANFVAVIFLAWMPSYLNRTFGMSLTMSGLNATFWLQAASVVGVLFGGWLADLWSRRIAGGRPLVQAIGLFMGAPLIALTGWTLDVPTLVVAMAGFGFCKGMYDANIWASLYDVVPAKRRATAQGLMNAIGWLGAGAGPIVIGAASARYGMGTCLSATSLIYVLFGTLLVIGTLVFVVAAVRAVVPSCTTVSVVPTYAQPRRLCSPGPSSLNPPAGAAVMFRHVLLASILIALPVRADDATDALAKELRDYATAELAKVPGKDGKYSTALPDYLKKRIKDANDRDREAWNKVKTRADWEKFRDERIEALRESLGTWPEVPRFMRIEVTKTIEADDYAIDNLLYESRPGVWVTGNLYRPAKTATRCR